MDEVRVAGKLNDKLRTTVFCTFDNIFQTKLLLSFDDDDVPVDVVSVGLFSFPVL